MKIELDIEGDSVNVFVNGTRVGGIEPAGMKPEDKRALLAVKLDEDRPFKVWHTFCDYFFHHFRNDYKGKDKDGPMIPWLRNNLDICQDSEIDDLLGMVKE